MQWFVVAQDRGQLSAFVNTVMNIRVLCNAGNFMSGFSTGGPL
jgi:hypothetical protein